MKGGLSHIPPCSLHTGGTFQATGNADEWTPLIRPPFRVVLNERWSFTHTPPCSLHTGGTFQATGSTVVDPSNKTTFQGGLK